MYKMINQTGELNPTTLFKKAEVRLGVTTRSTAGDPHKLVMPRSKLEVRKNFFTVRIIDKWNNLPVELKAAKNLQQFN